MTITNKKQNSKQKRIMVASVLIAATIALGGTFAWLTSTDSVTNRLTASADYGVSIVEDFYPPEDWVPGQEVDKAVGAVNTGNVSAMVKMTLANNLTVSYEQATETAFGTADKTYVKLSDTNAENEVLAAQAGGYLVAAYDKDGKAISSVTLGKLGTKYNVYSTVNGETTRTKAPAAGYYIFRSEDTTTKSWTYDGFYYDGSDYYKIKVTCGIQPTYGTGDTVTDSDDDGIADGGTFTVNFVTKTTVTNAATEFSYDSAKNCITATYDRGDTDKTNDIIVYINLQNVGTTDGWTYGGLSNNNDEAYFYLNKLLTPGETSVDLVKSVELSSEINQGAYVDLTYDLNVTLNSVQAVYTQTAEGKTTINTDKSATAALQLLTETMDDRLKKATVTAGTEPDSNGNIESGTVAWSKS